MNDSTLRELGKKLMSIEIDEKMSPVTGSKLSLFPCRPHKAKNSELTEQEVEKIKEFYEI